jgi:hypothetical protein
MNPVSSNPAPPSVPGPGQFLLITLLLVAVQAVALYFVLQALDLSDQRGFFYGMLAAFALISGLAGAFALRGLLKNNHTYFSGFFLGGVTLKLILAGVLVLIYRRGGGDAGGMTFVAPFALAYVPLLLLETLWLIRAARIATGQHP